MTALSVNPTDRYRSMSDFKRALEGQQAAVSQNIPAPNAPVYTQEQTPYPYPAPQPVYQQPAYPYQSENPAPQKSGSKAPVALLITAIVLVAAAAGITAAIFLSGVSLFPKNVETTPHVSADNADDAAEVNDLEITETIAATVAVTEATEAPDIPDATAFESASASSVLPDEAGYNYSPSNVLKNDSTCWCEGVNSYGEGEYIQLNLKGDQKLYGLDIINGYAGTERQYTYNSKLSQITVEFSNGEKLTATLDTYDPSQRNKIQTLTFDQPVVTSYVKITIDSVTKGECGDTCLSYVAPHPKEK